MTALAQALAARAGGLLLAALLGAGAAAAEGPFAPGWDLDPMASNIRFQSVKNETKVESSAFATFAGGIEPDGAASVRVMLDSVDTGIDLRNVRMRFLFFETFRFPEATIAAHLTPAMLADLPALRRKSLSLPWTFDLHGIRKEMQSEVVVTLLADDRVSVASGAPVSIAVADFGLAGNVGKLEEAAGGISIIPSATVTFDFVFSRRPTGAGTVVAAAPAAPTEPVSVALESQGDFGAEACRGRFEILSRTGHINFRIASARLTEDSLPFLASVVDIAGRCPGLTIEIAGHTDSDGGEWTNQRLSEARAAAVAAYLVEHGIEAGRVRPVGYGASRPVAPNDSPENKRRNRRIEFAQTSG